ncbi:DUF2339 domain-containing protein [Phreatobacter sp. AB_2022a]|uniref:DUF2339 domain-containing protein n=1 Tax=Phreatobacter sp. AB_2022a TaxID=3003134 RepID=UPI002286CEAE|nr:DUF2339 domain-containing protein [Phreatobacter sp. AB_2022a]MCZ0733691.1 DUF2339 domain-containing protein [Phreatobacter sp. AB_2022a]
MEIVFAVLIGLGLVLGVPILAIIAFVRSGDLKLRLQVVERRLAQSETELRLVREAMAAGAPPAAAAPAPPLRTGPEAVPEAPDLAEAQPAPEPEAAADPVPTPAAETRPARGRVPVIASAGPVEVMDPIAAPSEPQPAAPLPAPPKNLGDLEEAIGSRWAVWVGAIALGLGGIFLVRYSIEQGLFGPGMRITLGFLFSLALLVGGEWLRRSDKGLPTLPAADIPSALTGAGAVAAFATIYAAHALYGFIGPTATFLALGAVGVGTLVLAGLHGPLLGGIGLVAAFAAPFLVETDAPNPYVFPIYAAVITTACFALSWIRGWAWLALGATAASCGLGTIALFGTGGGSNATLVQAAAGLAAAAVFFVPGIHFARPRERGMAPRASLILFAFTLLGALAALEARQGAVAMVLFALIGIAVMALVWRAPAVVPALPGAGFATLLVMLGWVAGFKPSLNPDDLFAIAEPLPGVLSRIVWAGLAFALLYGIGPALLAVYRRQAEARTVLILAATSVIMPLGLLAIVYGKVEGFIISPRFAALAMVLAASFGVMTEATHRLRSGRRPGLAGASAVYAIGALAGVAFALTLLLQKAWLTLALGALIAGIAWVYTLRPLPALRWVAALTGIGVLARLVWDPAIHGGAVGETIIVNWLLPGYGVPALSAAVAAVLLQRRRGEDAPVQILEALAMVFTALLVIVEIRHAFGAYGRRLITHELSFAEAATHTATILAFGLGLSRLAGLRKAAVWQGAALILRYGSWAWIVLVMGLVANPWITGDPIGRHPVVNWALLGYGLAGVLALFAALYERRAGRDIEAKVMALMGSGLLFAWLNTTIAAVFRGPVVTNGFASDAEIYAYSAAWLALGIALLVAGAIVQSRVLRLTSAALVGLTVFKVFLYDMAGLTGLWRALSFIGLGLVLLLVGRIYQRALGIAGGRRHPPVVEEAGG